MSLPEPFIGRRQELAVLQESYKQKESSFFPIYGRRRVGKSKLILHFIKSHPAIYFLGKQLPAQAQIREFMSVAAEALKEPLLASADVQDWGAAFRQVVSRWHGKQKLILVFDEFQWMVEKSPELPSVLQELWDREWQKTGRMFLILCGSYVGFMEKEVLGKKSPLYGRRTGQIFLKPFNFLEAAQFHPRYSLVQKAATYFICGGIPLYLRFFSETQSVTQNIERLILREYAPLYREPDFLLREELREVEKYYSILMSLASGSKPSKAVGKKTDIADRSHPYYFKNLMELGYLGRRYPLGGVAATRYVRYEITDPFLRFWFRFIFPHTSLISQMGPQKAMAHIIKNQLDSYFGSCFEELCRQAMPLIYEKEGVSAAYEIGQFWDQKVQIDLVGLRNDGWVDIGECKWGKPRSFQSWERELKEKIMLFPNTSKSTVGPRLFVQDVPAGVDPSPAHGIKWHSLSDLYSLK